VAPPEFRALIFSGNEEYDLIPTLLAVSGASLIIELPNPAPTADVSITEVFEKEKAWLALLAWGGLAGKRSQLI
jgi:hypothetical protein